MEMEAWGQREKEKDLEKRETSRERQDGGREDGEEKVRNGGGSRTDRETYGQLANLHCPLT